MPRRVAALLRARGALHDIRQVYQFFWLFSVFHKAGHSPLICSNPFGGLLSRPFPFSGHTIWCIIHRSDCTHGQPDLLGYCACSSPRFQIGSLLTMTMTPINTLSPPFYCFAFVREALLAPNQLLYFSFMA
ncbi:hypothetical protein AVEN_19597-1 [Araneus ventricosus]|uniref:Uncharacterized protein n=1 Tax=Araneus ventricosus TaxID=182803 RepID=A0A4Y2KVQ3_ARAVE|nr:hypothetical protein AVEN_19597-1 [Araneus ventricosus]